MILDFGDGFFGVAYSSLKNDFGNGNGFMSMIFGTEGKIQDGKIYGKNGVVTLFDPNKFDMERVRSTMGLPHLTDHQTTLDNRGGVQVRGGGSCRGHQVHL